MRPPSFTQCVTPAVEQFPQALMGKSTRQKVCSILDPELITNNCNISLSFLLRVA